MDFLGALLLHPGQQQQLLGLRLGGPAGLADARRGAHHEDDHGDHLGPHAADAGGRRPLLTKV